MCGRYVRSRGVPGYVVPLEIDIDQRIPEADRPSWNVRPRTMQPVIDSAGTRIVRWGYLPNWAAAKKKTPIINARGEKLLGTAWKALTRRGRVIVPADGWYEWVTAGDGKKQPYYIRRRDGEPLWIAGLSSASRDVEPREHDGFMIVTAVATGGLVDIHDRRPVVFDPPSARDWLDAGESAEAVNDLVQHAALPAEAFEFFRLSAFRG